MDIKRPPKSKLRKRIRAGVFGLLGLALIGGLSFGLAKLKPADPTVDRSTVVIDSVKRGQMVRQVHGSGTLVPKLTRWIAAPADGRVEKILVEAGADVMTDTVIIELSNPQLEQEALDADFQLKGAQSDLDNLRVRLESDRMTQQAAVATINSEYRQSKLQLDTDEALARQGLMPELTLKLSRVRAEDLANRVKVEQERLNIGDRSIKAQIKTQQSKVEQLRALAKLKRDQADALKVRAGTPGVLQQVSVQIGQQVTPGLNIARVADPASLKAELRIPETQIKDIRLGQAVEVDTRNGMIPGHVSRIDPAAREGTFTVDAELTGTLPLSARPDLTVGGTIELERLDDVLYVSRPAFGQGESTVSMFRLDQDGQQAVRIPVKLGRSSVTTIEIISGLREGEQVILSDMSAWDQYNRIRLK